MGLVYTVRSRSLLSLLMDFFVRSEDKIARMAHKRYNNDGYRRARARTGGVLEPRLDDTVSYIVGHMMEAGLIRAKGEGTRAAVGSEAARFRERLSESRL